MNEQKLKKKVPQAKDYIENLSTKEWSVYSHINDNYLILIPEENVNIPNKDEAIKYLNRMELPGKELGVVCLNNCNAFLVDRKVLEAIARDN